jgi:DNA repair protein RecN (Recombination protein N)
VHDVVGEQRVSEIARMLGGERLSDTTHAHAREMLSTMAAVATKPKAKGSKA